MEITKALFEETTEDCCRLIVLAFMTNSQNLPLLVKCLSAIALIAFKLLVENSSPVKPCTTNRHGPDSVPSSVSMSLTAVDSGVFVSS